MCQDKWMRDMNGLDTTIVFMPEKAYACTDPRHYPPYPNAQGNPPGTGLSDVLFLP